MSVNHSLDTTKFSSDHKKILPLDLKVKALAKVSFPSSVRQSFNIT